VETACYTVQVRGSEIPKELLAAKAGGQFGGGGDDASHWNEDYE